jgi:hypothetical protein
MFVTSPKQAWVCRHSLFARMLAVSSTPEPHNASRIVPCCFTLLRHGRTCRCEHSFTLERSDEVYRTKFKHFFGLSQYISLWSSIAQVWVCQDKDEFRQLSAFIRTRTSVSLRTPGRGVSKRVICSAICILLCAFTLLFVLVQLQSVGCCVVGCCLC